MKSHLKIAAIAAAVLSGASTAALAQATANAITSAEDAFGTANGNESVGIYTQSSVRGFDLEAAGNYRVNGRYFVKSSGVSSFFIAQTDVRIGYNTLNLDFPGPSGVVDFTLRDPKRGEPHALTIGLEDYEQSYFELLLKHRNESGTMSGALGFSRKFELADEQGGRGDDALVAGVFRISPSTHLRLQAFGGEYTYRRNGRFAIILPGAVETLPDEIERETYLGQSWAVERGQRRIAGVLADVLFDGGWRWSTDAVFSQEAPNRSYTQLFIIDPADGLADARVAALPEQRLTAYSGETSFGWRGAALGAQHDIAVHGRWRASRNRFGGAVFIDEGEVELGAATTPVAPPVLDGRDAPLRNEIDQWGVGASWQARSERVRLNAGVLKTDYRKTLFDPETGLSENKAAPWLYNFGAAYQLREGVDVYGSYSRGIEESGVAPGSAANRNAVLPAGISTQREFGVRAGLRPGLNLIVAGFDTRKPTPGINAATGNYEIIGDVRHRGVELSVSGAVSESVSVVAGGVYTDAEVSGDGVDAGTIGARPVAAPKWRLIGNVNYDPGAVRGLSLDASIRYVGDQAARASPLSTGGQLAVPSDIVVDLGFRYAFNPGAEGWLIRAQVKNVLNSYDWQVNKAEALNYTPSRAFRLLATRTF